MDVATFHKSGEVDMPSVSGKQNAYHELLCHGFPKLMDHAYSVKRW
jgi:hypothetical protein